MALKMDTKELFGGVSLGEGHPENGFPVNLQNRHTLGRAKLSCVIKALSLFTFWSSL